MGIDNATPETIAGIAGRVSIPSENLAHLPFAADASSIGQAIRDADRVGRDFLDRISEERLT